jgi:hypothetical protein
MRLSSTSFPLSACGSNSRDLEANVGTKSQREHFWRTSWISPFLCLVWKGNEHGPWCFLSLCPSRADINADTKRALLEDSMDIAVPVPGVEWQ